MNAVLNKVCTGQDSSPIYRIYREGLNERTGQSIPEKKNKQIKGRDIFGVMADIRGNKLQR